MEEGLIVLYYFTTSINELSIYRGHYPISGHKDFGYPFINDSMAEDYAKKFRYLLCFKYINSSESRYPIFLKIKNKMYEHYRRVLVWKRN